MEQMCLKVELKCVLTELGVQYVTVLSVKMKPALYVINYVIKLDIDTMVSAVVTGNLFSGYIPVYYKLWVRES